MSNTSALPVRRARGFAKIGQGAGREGWEMVREGFSRDGTSEKTMYAERELEHLGRRKPHIQEVLRWD